MKSKWSGDLWGMSKSHAEPYATIPYLNRLPCDLCGGLYSFLTDIYHSVEKNCHKCRIFLENLESEASHLNFSPKITKYSLGFLSPDLYEYSRQNHIFLVDILNFCAKNHFWVAL